MKSPLKYTPKELKEIAQAHYPSQQYLLEVTQLIQLYRDIDTSRMVSNVLGRLSNNNNPPIHQNVLRTIVDRLAVAYDAPPIRMLIRPDGEPLPTFSPENKALEAYLRKADWDAKWTEINSYKELLSTVFLRLYPSDHNRTIKPVLYTPDIVFRKPIPEEPDDISADEAFCIQLGETSGGKPLFEYWEREGRAWKSWVVREDGEIIRTPFGPTGEVPYPSLPVLSLHNTAGACPMAYYPVKQSRIDTQICINKMWTDLDDILSRQGFSSLVVKTEEPERFKDATISPDKGISIRPEEDITTLDYRPLLRESLDVVNDLIKVWLTTEGLPPSDAEWVQYRSAPGEKARMLPLYEKRRKMLPLVKKEQEKSYQILAGVLEFKASEWETPTLDLTLMLDARSAGIEELDNLDTNQVQAAILEIQAGLGSPVEYLRRKYGCSRQEAEDLYRQNQEDLALYPLRSSSVPALGE